MEQLDIQDAWCGDSLHGAWQHSPDGKFLLERAASTAVAITAAGAGGVLLDVAAAEGEVTCRLRPAFSRAVIVEPSCTMLARAGANMQQHGTPLERVRGIAETLPFPDGMFDRVLCHSAMDHLADPERGIREMARVVKTDGRVVLTFVNYGGVAARGSRWLYALGERFGVIPPASEARRLPWDSPVPYEHNFECTWADLAAMCEPYLELDWARGVSLGWGFPGWGKLLARRPRLERLITLLDRVVQPRPALADFVVSVWRPRARATWPVDDLRVRPTNPVYRRLIRDEAAYWANADFGLFFSPGSRDEEPRLNADLTGDPKRSWLDDLAGRGPFRDVAVLGCDDSRWDAEWLRRGASPTLDVYELSAGVIAKVAQRLGPLADRVRFIETDLNFCTLPDAAYDCIWASATLHCLVNLEHVLNQVHRALRPGGIFAVRGWTGENRMQYGARRLDLANAALATVPESYRRTAAVERPSPAWKLSPFTAVRSEDIRASLGEHPGFDVVHIGAAGWLFPLMFVVDGERLAAERPDVLQGLRAAETAARSDPSLSPTYSYIVLRRRQ